MDEKGVEAAAAVVAAPRVQAMDDDDEDEDEEEEVATANPVSKGKRRASTKGKGRAPKSRHTQGDRTTVARKEEGQEEEEEEVEEQDASPFEGEGGELTTAASAVLRAKEVDPSYTGTHCIPWSEEEDVLLVNSVKVNGAPNWKSVAATVPDRNHEQCRQRWSKVHKSGTRCGLWSPDEDMHLTSLVKTCTSRDSRRMWTQIAALVEGRTSKQCRERWCNHLDPTIRHDTFDTHEDALLTQQHALLGIRWSAIARMLPGRTEDAVKLRLRMWSG
jgi:hypothetical protein